MKINPREFLFVTAGFIAGYKMVDADRNLAAIGKKIINAGALSSYAPNAFHRDFRNRFFYDS